MKYKNGEEFLNSLYNNMYMEEAIMHTAEKSDSPTEKISKYLERLERIHDIAKDNPHKMEVLKKFYYDKYVIKELPESYINLQKKIARERGYGDITVTDEKKEEMLLNVQKEQKESLDMWIDYLTSDDAMYPMWFKHYAFRGMLKLNKFDKEKWEFGRRGETTTDAFIELNSEALAGVYNTLVKEIGTNEEISEEVRKALEKGESFKSLYEYYLTDAVYVNRGSDADGIWVKYDQGSDYRPLCKSLQGKNTGWCTRWEETAKTQLSNGDFYIYYTKDNEGAYKEPRIAIRMDGKDNIGEVRGVGEHQNLEGCMTSIAEKKLNEFPDKDKYLKKVNDMKLLTEIDKKVNEAKELTKEELSFLYEVESEIEGFGYSKDPRIKEIRDKRNNNKDLAFVFDCEEENIGTKLSDFDKNEIICFYGDLEYDDKTLTDNFRSLQCITGNAHFKNLTSAKGLENLQSIGGDASFGSLISAKELENLQNIGGYASFDSLISAKGLGNLQSIGGTAYFYNLSSAKGLESLQSIGENASFDSLISAEGLGSLQSIGWDAHFNSLISAEGLESLQNIGREASYHKLISAKGLGSLQNIGGDAYFDSLISAEGLGNLQNIGGDAYFDNLISAKGLESLQSIGGDACFENLTSAKGLESLRSIMGCFLVTDDLSSANELENLQRMSKGTYLENLETVNGEDATKFKEEINNRGNKTL